MARLMIGANCGRKPRAHTTSAQPPICSECRSLPITSRRLFRSLASPATISKWAISSGPDRLVDASIQARSASLVKPSENFGPEIRTRVAANKCREVLQPNARLAGIFYDAKLLAWHFIEKCLDGARKDHSVGR